MIITLRLPEQVESDLLQEARLRHSTRSQLVRQAIVDFLALSERQRRMEGLVAEMRQAYADPARREEARQEAEEALDDGLDELSRREARDAADPDDRWWR